MNTATRASTRLMLLACLLPLQPFVTRIDGCDDDADGDGWTAIEGDCDDQDPQTWPGAPEQCDATDNDCDALIDEGLVTIVQYVDDDGDGFGAEVESCQEVNGAVSRRGDCDDADAGIHPCAADVPDDDVDQDCGGSDGAQPSVGLEASAYPTVQAALDAAVRGDTVWVGPGTYLEYEVTFRGKRVTLISTDFAEATVIDAGGQGTVMVMNSRETRETVLDGFTLTGGEYSWYSGGMYLSFSSPTVNGCILSGNAGGSLYGGGMYMESSSPLLTHCTIAGNVPGPTTSATTCTTTSPIRTPPRSSTPTCTNRPAPPITSPASILPISPLIPGSWRTRPMETSTTTIFTSRRRLC